MIRFGTSGWRAVISDEFTFRNVRLVTQAIASMLLDDPRRQPKVVVGYDTRFLSERMAREAATVLSANHVQAFLCDRDAPTPAVSLEIRNRGAAGAIYFTASHNPPEYNGLKFYDGNGAPAPSELTDRIEMEVVRLESHGFARSYFPDDRLITEIDPQDSYLAHVTDSINVDAIRAAGLRFAVDTLYGTSREYLDRILIENDCAVEVIHNFADPYFGGYSPACTASNLEELSGLVAETGADLGLATDGDGDRFGIIASDGAFVPVGDVLPMLVDYLATERGVTGAVARTVGTSHLIDRVAARHGLPIVETRVGFKYIAEKLLRGEAELGLEQTAGFTRIDHLPEKDGTLACLLVAEMVATSGRSLLEQRERLWSEHGRLYQDSGDVMLTGRTGDAFRAVAKAPPQALAGRKVTSVGRLDGVKMELDGGDWCLVRRSGTEPMVRIQSEAREAGQARAMIDECRLLLEQ